MDRQHSDVGVCHLLAMPEYLRVFAQLQARDFDVEAAVDDTALDEFCLASDAAMGAGVFCTGFHGHRSTWGADTIRLWRFLGERRTGHRRHRRSRQSRLPGASIPAVALCP